MNSLTFFFCRLFVESTLKFCGQNKCQQWDTSLSSSILLNWLLMKGCILWEIALLNCCKFWRNFFFSASCIVCPKENYENWNNCWKKKNRMRIPHSTFSNRQIQQKQTTQFMQINYKFGRYLLKHLISLKILLPEKVKFSFTSSDITWLVYKTILEGFKILSINSTEKVERKRR